MLELRDLVLKPGAGPINHRFPGGRITVVLGRNHSGKTAFCRMLAGLAEPVARTVVRTVQAPLDDEIRNALVSLFGMLWGEMQPSMAPEDREEYRRLTDPKSPDFILDSPGYYAFFTYSMFEGRVASG